jgi:hypothetical protein
MGNGAMAKGPQLPRPSSTLPLRPIVALQFFGRYLGHSRHRDALEPEGPVAIDPLRHFCPMNCCCAKMMSAPHLAGCSSLL